jgi:hypothetical protein
MLPTKSTPRTRATTEHDEQKKLIHKIRNELAPKYKILRWLYANQNGLKLHPAIVTQMINEGAKKGVHDLFLPVQSYQKRMIYDVAIPMYSGLYIEMKSAKGKLTPEQIDFKIFVESQGFKVVVPRSCDEALREILYYCGIELSD